MPTYRLKSSYADPAAQKRAVWVAKIMSGAGATAAKLGVSPEAIVTQAALETGWGKSAIGHNIFGIKADKSWHGATQVVRTREVIDGRDVIIDDKFRDYGSYQESIDDHFRFLVENSRYKAAGVFNAGSDEKYFEALQKAGYATDPNYAATLKSVLKLVRTYTANMEQVDDGSRDVLPAPPPGTVRDASGNVRIKDIKDSTIIRDSTSGRRGNWLQTALSTISLGGLGAYLDKLNGLDWKVVGILTGAGLVILGAGFFTDWKFGGIFQARKQMHDKGIV